MAFLRTNSGSGAAVSTNQITVLVPHERASPRRDCFSCEWVENWLVLDRRIRCAWTRAPQAVAGVVPGHDVALTFELRAQLPLIEIQVLPGRGGDFSDLQRQTHVEPPLRQIVAREARV